ncbi:GMC family oxidoreductase [Streptomyces sp. CB01881]|uniref:GMC family oxidoreductase n=1 Tax=Streptomyces sp. CB01881 TaxID=2078691 RepID=UPI000CDC2EC5|nr:GMC family oxidoreductase [Streptomyces sp. CB01881]AUY53430.1 GMC family oxidoreductase [Streptomyces sp. CB01881]TYC69582.1 GMC family oxidoreductase [Streptomyces sp. CB01881]
MDPNTPYDVVIIGAGVAGALTACRLATSRPGARILLMEAGNNPTNAAQRAAFVDTYQISPTKPVPSPYAELLNNKDGFAPSSDGVPDLTVMNQYYDETGPDVFASGFQRMIGGSTWAWRGNTPRFVPNDFQLKSKYGVGVDWPFGYDELEPYYVQAENELGISGNADEWIGITPRSGDYPMPGMAPSYGDELVRAALSTIKPIDGVPVRIVTTPQARNSQPYRGRSACQGNSSCIPICPTGAKYDASFHVNKARDELGVELRTAHVATRIVPPAAADQPYTVVFRDWTTADHAEQQLTARHVVLALNAIETPKLWLLSGLGNSSDQVGRNLMDHHSAETIGLFGQPVYPFRGPQSALGVDTFRDGTFRNNNGAFRMTIGNDGWGRSGSPEKTLQSFLWDDTNKKIKLIGKPLQQALADKVTRMLRISISTEQLPDPDNRVTLSDKTDALGIRRPKIAYKLDDYSKRALAYGHSVTRRMWQHLEDTAGATQVSPVQPTLKYNGAGHLMGTMRMGEKGTAVVDAWGSSHEHPGIWVVGSSVFPTGGTANPTLTISALALRTADALAAAL